MASSNSPVVSRRRRRIFLPVVLVLAVVAAGGWAFVNRPWEPKPLVVVVETATAGPASRVLAVNGRIEPELSVNVSPTVGGQVKEVPVKDGDTVKAGAELARIDDTQQQSAVQQASAALDAAVNKLQQAKIDLERAKSLGDAISRKDLDSAQLALQTAQNSVDQLTAAKNQALSLLAAYNLTAPFDGTVLTRAVDPGQVVGTTTVLFTFADLTHLRAEASIDEIYSAEMKRGLKARLQPSGYTRTLEGEVSFVSPTVDTSTGGRLIRVAIDDKDGLNLPIGLTVTLNVVVDEEAEAITVPRTAIVTTPDGPAVYVIANGKAALKPIEYIDWPSERLIVTSGLTAGDVVITVPKGVSSGALVAAKAA